MYKKCIKWKFQGFWVLIDNTLQKLKEVAHHNIQADHLGGPKFWASKTIILKEMEAFLKTKSTS